MNKLWKYIKDHKTRITGYVTVVSGSCVTLVEPLRDFLTRKEISALLVFAGVVTALCGHANASRPSDPPAE